MAGESLTRQDRGRVLHELGIRFKSGDSTERRNEDLAILDRMGVETVDLVEAGERIKVTRMTTTYPPLSEILSRCSDARRDRLRISPDDGPSANDRPMTADELAHSREILALYRAGLVWCGHCRRYGPHCEPHYALEWISPRPAETAAALAALPPGERKSRANRTRVPQKPSDAVAAGIQYVIDERRKREAAQPAEPTAETGLTPLGDALDLF